MRPRSPERVRHTVVEMIRFAVFKVIRSSQRRPAYSIFLSVVVGSPNREMNSSGLRSW